jgi:hypothetical protein
MKAQRGVEGRIICGRCGSTCNVVQRVITYFVKSIQEKEDDPIIGIIPTEWTDEDSTSVECSRCNAVATNVDIADTNEYPRED